MKQRGLARPGARAERGRRLDGHICRGLLNPGKSEGPYHGWLLACERITNSTLRS